MAYDTTILKEKAIEAIRKSNLIFVEDVCALIGINKSTYYDHFPIASNDSNELTKMLEKILDSAWKLDDKQKPHILIFSNYARNNSYVVEPLQMSFSQGVDNNMIWFYSIELKAVADGNLVKSNFSKSTNKKFLTTVANATIAKGLSDLIRKSIKNFNMSVSKQ